MAGLKLLSRAACLASALLTILLPVTVAAISDSNNVTSPASSSYINDKDDVKIAINVPEGAQKTDLYFSFEAPASYDWVGFGMGMVMDNSLMFVVYRSADDQGEPTVSPRLGQNHVMPEWYNATQVNVLEGSEVTNEKFVVNIHCKSCRNWGDGSLDLKNQRARFFYALGPSGKTLLSDNSNERIQTHPSHPRQFSMNMTAATGLNGIPIFDSKDTTENDANRDVSIGGIIMSSRGVAFHAFIMSFAFSVVFPLGYLFLRIFDRLWMHWGTQAFGTLLVFLGMVAGVVISVKELQFPKQVWAHQIVGLIAVGFVILAMGLGGAGHMSFRKRGVPSPIMKAHRIVGPLAIVIGFSAAILGLLMAGRKRAVIGYVVFDTLVWIVVLGLVFLKTRRNRKKGVMNTAAAQNFREANTAYSHVRGGSGPRNEFEHAPAVYIPAAQIPLQSRETGQRFEPYSIRPTK